MRIGLGMSIVGGGGGLFTSLADIGGVPTAAYSVRKVNSAYSGAAIRVRESSGGVETDIGFVGQNLDEAALLAHCGANDGFVTKWYDQSGNGYDAIQGTAASQPQIVSAGSVIKENGLPALQYDGNNDFLSVPNSKSTFKFLHDGTTATTFNTIRIGDGSTVNDVAYVIWATTVASADVGAGFSYEDRAIVNASDGLQFVVQRDIAGLSVCGSRVDDIFLPNTQSLLYGLIDADNATASERFRGAVNGATDSGNNTLTNPPKTADATNDMQIGRYLTGSGANGSYLLGNMQEIVFYASDKSSLRTAIEGNINGYYSIYTP